MSSIVGHSARSPSTAGRPQARCITQTASLGTRTSHSTWRRQIFHGLVDEAPLASIRLSGLMLRSTVHHKLSPVCQQFSARDTRLSTSRCWPCDNLRKTALYHPYCSPGILVMPRGCWVAVSFGFVPFFWGAGERPLSDDQKPSSGLAWSAQHLWFFCCTLLVRPR